MIPVRCILDFPHTSTGLLHQRAHNGEDVGVPDRASRRG
eukprot:SAG22_NODE_18198_length_291_cov_0.807292_1_plen_38_part_10